MRRDKTTKESEDSKQTRGTQGNTRTMSDTHPGRSVGESVSISVGGSVSRPVRRF